ncbi:MAG: hypothetical protein ACLU5K_02605 [Christensenellales bacterium]
MTAAATYSLSGGAPPRQADWLDPGGGGGYHVSNLAREKRTQIRGGGQDVYTIMVYMCGTDLESNYGMATSDINEMLHADLSDKVNIIVETGGADKWQNTVISSKVNQIYQVKNEGILRLEADFGKKAMTKAETLTEFIQYCEQLPADRYASQCGITAEVQHRLRLRPEIPQRLHDAGRVQQGTHGRGLHLRLHRL